MRIVLRRTTMVNLIVLAIASATAVAHRPAAPQGTPADATARIVTAAQAVLATLDEAGRAKVQFPFDGPQKTRWSNLPSRSSSGRACGWRSHAGAARRRDELLTTALSPTATAR